MERLQKVIAAKGYCSRRKAEELIIQGRVKVNNVVVTTLGTKVGKNDQINNQILMNENSNKIYLMLNKRRNCVSTMYDPQHRKTVLTYVKGISERIYPVGRLDYDTSGLLLLTNDGEFTNIITHPSHIINKTYHVLLSGYLSKQQLQQLATGIEIEPGIIRSQAQAKLVKYEEVKNVSILLLTIHEVRKHQVKKMIQSLGHEVIKLKRIAIGFLQLDETLKPGEWRYLKPKEIKRFFGIASHLKTK
ncbi:pseudouridine synthase [Spiroplasma citri]|uniref:pseudouridine synthase n=1 Tax=Spiroplasma citri TaxID=2133 RepID=UPI0011BBEB65|nr:pseudouridine synthase [Spiroplasma citri]QED24360.1 rRNA pseudouridine synthase [Spiroplasma citri]